MTDTCDVKFLKKNRDFFKELVLYVYVLLVHTILQLSIRTCTRSMYTKFPTKLRAWTESLVGDRVKSFLGHAIALKVACDPNLYPFQY